MRPAMLNVYEDYGSLVHYQADDLDSLLDADEDEGVDFDDRGYASFVCHDANLKRLTTPSA